MKEVPSFWIQARGEADQRCSAQQLISPIIFDKSADKINGVNPTVKPILDQTISEV
jgi:hypothetical protein